MSAYLQNLTVRLAEGVGRLSEQTRQRHTDYFLAAQQPDGGFSGREGGSDLYYTTFALRGLSILGELYGEVAQRVESFLKSKLSTHQSIVDFFSLFYAANLLKVSAGKDIFADADPNWPNQVANFLETLRRPDGGYAKAPEGNAGSTYHNALVLFPKTGRRGCIHVWYRHKHQEHDSHLMHLASPMSDTICMAEFVKDLDDGIGQPEQ
jgi:geranylgeranyl transferase type-2 subunit beta